MRKKIILVVVLAFIMLSMSYGTIRAAESFNDSQMDWTALYRRSLINEGDSMRLHKVLNMAREGKPVVIATIGGSITMGAAASSESNCYAALLEKWFKETFPKTEITLVNAGIGATGSKLGAYRASADILKHNPDLVVIEYAVNDPGSNDTLLSMEGLVRQILKQPNKPAAMMVFTMNKDGYNVQDFHEKIGKYYHLPMISYRDAFWPEITAGRIKWEDIAADGVHPNDQGHAYIARLLTSHLENVMSDPETSLQSPADLPPALYGNEYEFVNLLTSRIVKPLQMNNWISSVGSSLGRSWRCRKENNLLELDVYGTGVDVVFRCGNNEPLGLVRVSVDDLPPVILNGYTNFGGGWYMRTETVAEGLEKGPHRVKIELLDDIPQGGGHSFEIFAVGVFGSN